MRLLWFGDLAPTGFGTVTADTGREMVKLGVDIRFVSQNDIGELEEPFVSRTLDLAFFRYGNEGVEGISDFVPRLLAGRAPEMKLANGEPWGEWKPDAAFLLGDFYGMREMVHEFGLDAFRQVPTFHYAPIEGHNLPPKWNEIWSVITPIAMTEFGRIEIEKVTGSRPPLVYHGVDAEAFHPVSPSTPIRVSDDDKALVLTSKAACKYFFFSDPTLTVVLRTDRFMPRKGYDSLIRAMAPVMRQRSSLILALHCRERDYGGYMPDIISKYPDIAPRIFNPQFGFVSREILVAMYNAADLYASTSAEGFGLTIAEAIACGTPAVGIDYSAVPEVIGPAGQTVPVGRVLDNEYGHHWALPDEEAFGERVSYLIDHPNRRLELGRLGPRHVAKNFRWDVAAQRFLDIAQRSLQSAPQQRRAPIADERVMVAA